MKTTRAGRVTLDSHGVHLGKFLWFFGASFDLPWSSISGWAFGADVIQSRRSPKGEVVQWVFELDVGGKTHVMRLPPDTASSRAVLEVLQARLPPERAPRVGRAHNGRLPPAMAALVGPDHEEPGAQTPSRESGWKN